MSDEDPNRRQDANSGESDMDLDDLNVEMTESDDEDFQMASEDAAMMNFALPIRVGPQRVRSNEGGVADRQHELLFNTLIGRFSESYRVLSARHLEETRGHANLESGGKVILPPDALEQLSRNSSALMRPMMFKATNRHNGKSTHHGVLEFIADWRTCYMPTWMMDLLGAADNDMIQFERVELPTATFAKFQPQSVDFLEISDPRAVLENTLRHFACLSKGDVITIPYNSRKYQLLVLETLPRDAVTIIECDMDVDFAAPVGYVSPSSSDTEVAGEDVTDQKSVFTGSGIRLNGRTIDEPGAEPGSGSKPTPPKQSGSHAPDTDWVIGSLKFTRKIRPSLGGKSGTDGGDGGGGGGSPKFTAFGGMGNSLRSVKKHKINDDLAGGGGNSL